MEHLKLCLLLTWLGRSTCFPAPSIPVYQRPPIGNIENMDLDTGKKDKDARPNPAIWCTGQSPCYQYVLNLVMDGIRDIDDRPDAMLTHYAIAGMDRRKVIEIGRQALQYFEEKYGLVFSVTDEELVTNGGEAINNTAGTATVKPFYVSPNSRYRLYSAAVGDQIQLYNAPLSNGGWAVTFTHEFTSTGSLRLSIPAGAGTFYGHYIIAPCVNQYPGVCTSILNPWRPSDPLVIRYEAHKYFLFDVEPHYFTFVDVDVSSDLFGRGIGHGYLPRRDNTRNTIEGWQNMVFPNAAYPLGMDE